MNEIDTAQNGKISYTEFLAATVDYKSVVTEQKLWMIFKRFDVDNTDYISKMNIIQAVEKLGHNITLEEVEEAIKKHDITYSGNINFTEFCLMLNLQEIGSPLSLPMMSPSPDNNNESDCRKKEALDPTAVKSFRINPTAVDS